MSESILFVTGNPVHLRKYSDLLEKQELSFYTAKTGNEGYKEYVRHEPLLTILDSAIPGMSYFDLAKDMLNHLSQSRIILLTELATEWSQEKAIRAGFRDILIKPFSDEEFLTTVEVYSRRKDAGAN